VVITFRGLLGLFPRGFELQSARVGGQHVNADGRMRLRSPMRENDDYLLKLQAAL
jgi:hypothetical protein